MADGKTDSAGSTTAPTSKEQLELKKLDAEIAKTLAETRQLTAPWYKKAATYAIMIPAAVSIAAIGLGIVTGAVQAKLDLMNAQQKELKVQGDAVALQRQTLADDQQKFAADRVHLSEQQIAMEREERYSPVSRRIIDLLAPALNGDFYSPAVVSSLAGLQIDKYDAIELTLDMRRFAREFCTDTRSTLVWAALYMRTQSRDDEIALEDAAFSFSPEKTLWRSFNSDAGWAKAGLSLPILRFIVDAYARIEGSDKAALRRVANVVASYVADDGTLIGVERELDVARDVHRGFMLIVQSCQEDFLSKAPRLKAEAGQAREISEVSDVLDVLCKVSPLVASCSLYEVAKQVSERNEPERQPVTFLMLLDGSRYVPPGERRGHASVRKLVGMSPLPTGSTFDRNLKPMQDWLKWGENHQSLCDIAIKERLYTWIESREDYYAAMASIAVAKANK